MKFGLVGLLAGTMVATGGRAEETTAPCPPPPAFKAWSAPASSALTPGRSKNLSLTRATTFRRAPGKLPKAGTYGGLVPVFVPKPGAYLIALSVPAWIDVVHGGTVVPSVNHARAEQCTGIHKIVRFPLAAGPHVIQISGSPAPGARIMIARAP